MIFKSKKITQKETSTETSQPLDTKREKSSFLRLSESQKRYLRLFSIMAGIALIAFLVTLSLPEKKKTKEPTPAEKKKYSLLPEKVDKSLWIAAEGENVARLQKQVESMEGKLTQMEKLIEEINQKTSKPQPQKGTALITPPGLPPLEKQAKGKKLPAESAGVPGQEFPSDMPIPPPPGVVPEKGAEKTKRGLEQEKKEGKKIRIFENELKEDKKDSDKKKEAKKEKTIWIPAGTIIKGVLLTGMDAPTDVGATKDPLPVAILIRDVAILPNQFGMDLSYCIVVGSGWGNLADERAYIRSETLSCIDKKGKAIETSLKGHVFSSEDGKSGMRGRYVSKQGQKIAMALLAGVVSSTGQALSETNNIEVNIYDRDTHRNIPPVGTALAQAGLGGIGRAAKSVADFYLKLAEKMYPIIEIDAGRKVEILVLKGQEIKIKEDK